MNKFGVWKILVVSIAALSIFGAMDARAQVGAGSGEKNGDRLHFVKRLLETSSAARRIKESDNQEAKLLYEEALELYKTAERARDMGDEEAIEVALFHATETMFQAVRLVELKKLQEDKAKREFQRRLDSINALLEAYSRIGKEKGMQGESSKLRKKVLTRIENAKKIFDEGHIYTARVALDEIYIQIKVAISDLRNGDTLVRSLNFASKKEEYLYELDRNDTHKMLVKLLLKEKLKDNAAMRNMVQVYLDKADSLRKKAEAQAAAGDYAAAVKTCEESTRQLVRAIRGSGLYIPG